MAGEMPIGLWGFPERSNGVDLGLIGVIGRFGGLDQLYRNRSSPKDTFSAL